MAPESLKWEYESASVSVGPKTTTLKMKIKKWGCEVKKKWAYQTSAGRSSSWFEVGGLRLLLPLLA